MTLIAVLIGIAVVALSSVIIMRGCDSFDFASDYLGQRMPPGVKGATINAIGSSLPELFTTTILLFLYRDIDGYSGGIATCAGSAVFNSIIIPALCIGGVVFIGVKRRGKRGRQRINAITVGKSTILRDGFFLIAAELVLIYFLGGDTMTWWMGGMLMAVYLVYFGVLMLQIVRYDADTATVDGEDTDDDGPATNAAPSFVNALWRFDFNQLFFAGRALNRWRAWTVLAASVTVIGAGCFALSWAVVEVARALDVALYFTTVILAAAATSVPDTVLSVKDALKGRYDDAISNALGSNIFDITVALGLPLLIYGLIYGDVHLAATGGANADVQILRVVLLAFTGAVIALFLIGAKTGRFKAIIMIMLYVLWTGFIIGRAAKWPLVMAIGA